LFEALQGGIERALIDIEHAAAGLLEALADSPPVHGFEGEGFEDQEIQGAAEDVGWDRGHEIIFCWESTEECYRSCRKSRGRQLLTSHQTGKLAVNSPE
jgi:hypothetical protein